MTSAAPTDHGLDSSLGASALGRLIVCERSDQWAVGLRGELEAVGVRMWECRTLGDAWEALATDPAAFIVVEVTPENIEALLRRMIWFSRDFPHARIAVVAGRQLRSVEWMMREAGAVHFVASPRHLASLVELALRHLARAPQPRQSLVERIWASLPWEDIATRA